ncbi:unnamed protein product [Polarella glacialis]|uniref:Uncharacterized protein n=1 Tax=Polarella glacialis TaxID=89957 RepID=A0A813K0L0_POLGL|nr:unnamed protein product [Polarella glacialis]
MQLLTWHAARACLLSQLPDTSSHATPEAHLSLWHELAEMQHSHMGPMAPMTPEDQMKDELDDASNANCWHGRRDGWHARRLGRCGNAGHAGHAQWCWGTVLRAVFFSDFVF